MKRFTHILSQRLVLFQVLVWKEERELFYFFSYKKKEVVIIRIHLYLGYRKTDGTWTGFLLGKWCRRESQIFEMVSAEYETGS